MSLISAAGLIADFVGVVILTLDLVPEYRVHLKKVALQQLTTILTEPAERTIIADAKASGEEPPSFWEVEIEGILDERLADLWARAGIDEPEWEKMVMALKTAESVAAWPFRPEPFDPVLDVNELVGRYTIVRADTGLNEAFLPHLGRQRLGLAILLILGGFAGQAIGTVGSAWC